ncbi:E3 ubiquitin-protein ligase SH3RF1 [Balaenoptera musculus]|uniref:E3 ubiquitin-protein ligase SH3RF1 n=1 Tax=Balaenoptera musculus TaxID=9771 RepID=A0A8B8XQ43_BALMU|nr:E3 ubiquitin-protein ligase SH3RF1 [Balaenoptera musculus]XP_036711960.1 E3 ubiquitin-protein ligase SH3RF1 [Balaenoptera musculus]XP_036711961.1 E3 ubiquitin-protein ligase SH3RF1 [Balaenoptera musculus]XP_036711962.1 E3 ubiquitin-protein ligase SH3RF1 [Balaenoptera musculus]XP_036711963.1 E3 ubiquitin-protein ligase SH3RF1 [Balaenoptera musculus]
MDESALLDLLECPVCLERLDVSARVLPCQHTFCKRCLLGIVGSRNELRCPECRTLVGAGVEQLPSNILLVRLLDGIKQRPWKPGPAGGSGPNCTNASRAPSSAVATCSSKDPPCPQGGQQPRAQAWSPPVRGIPQLPCAKALYNYEGKEPGDLKFSKGDIIILRRQVDENWYHGEVNGVHGFFPTNFVQIIKPLPQPPPQCKALYDFEVKDKEADKDCLPFAKDDVLTVIRRVDENWAEGMLADKIGIFPISYVEFNSAAKQLIEWDQPPAGGVGAGEGAPAAAPSSAAPKQPEAKKNTKKRHSFTSLTTASKASQATQQRHSMEISPPVLISSSNPTAAARIGELAGLSCSAPSQVHISTTGLIVTPPPSSPVTTGPSSTVPPEAPYPAALSTMNPPLPPPPLQAATPMGAVAASGMGSRPVAGPTDQTAHSRPQTRPSVYVAIYPYTPRKEDELELRKGEMFLVFERCQDGWFKGTSMHTSKIGVFPGNYVAPVTRAVTSASQGKVPVSTAGQTSRGGGPASPAPTGAPAQKPPGNGMAGGPGVPTAVVSAAHIQTSPQAKVLLHMSGQMTVNQARSAVRTVSAHSQERPTAAVTPIQVQSAAGLPHHPLASPQPPGPMGPPAHVAAGSLGRVGAPLACAAAPPSLPAASLETEPGGRPVTMLPGPPTSPDSGSAAKPDKDSKKERKGLLKLLSGASTKRKPRGSPPASPTLDVEPGAELLPGAPSAPCACPGPCDADAPAPAPGPQRRTCSLDSAPVAPPPRQPCSSLGPAAGDARPAVCERGSGHHLLVVKHLEDLPPHRPLQILPEPEGGRVLPA